MLGIIQREETPIFTGASINYLKTSVDRADAQLGSIRRDLLSHLLCYDHIVHEAMTKGVYYKDGLTIDY
jgi:hypothetical protein